MECIVAPGDSASGNSTASSRISFAFNYGYEVDGCIVTGPLGRHTAVYFHGLETMRLPFGTWNDVGMDMVYVLVFSRVGVDQDGRFR